MLLLRIDEAHLVDTLTPKNAFTSPHDQLVTRGNLCIKGRVGLAHVQNRGPEA